MRVAVIGVGLIGASVALGLRGSGFAEDVLGVDSDPDHLEEALAAKAINAPLEFGQDERDMDLWVLATPPEAVRTWLDRLQALELKPEATLTDCASVKQSIMDHVPSALAGRFVGGHPIAGSAERGAGQARADLFRDAPWILTTARSEPTACRRVEQMVYALDAHPVFMQPDEHDRHVAVVSHLPNILANLLANMGVRLERPDLTGASWVDLTRVAGHHPELWQQVLRHNREPVRAAIAELRARLDELDQALLEDDVSKLRSMLETPD